MARKINAVSPNESRLNGYFAAPERRNTSNFRGISYEDERRAHANEIYESGTKWVNEQLQNGGGSGGGGAQPDWAANEGEAGHILNRTHYWEKVDGVLLDETIPVDVNTEGCAIYKTLPLIAGETYKVTYNGTEYQCVCNEIDMDGMTVLAMGNIGALTGGEPTGEMFVLLAVSDEMAEHLNFNAMCLPLDGADSAKMTIEGVHYTYRKVGAEYLPGEYCHFVPVKLVPDSAGNCWVSSALGYGNLYPIIKRKKKDVVLVVTVATKPDEEEYFRLFSVNSERIVFTKIKFTSQTINQETITFSSDGSNTHRVESGYITA